MGKGKAVDGVGTADIATAHDTSVFLSAVSGEVISKKRRYIVVIAPSVATRGGISAVVDAYKRGLADRWPMLYISSHTDGNWWQKLVVALGALARFISLSVSGRVAIVHVHSASNASFWRKSLFISIARLGRQRVVFHLHGGGFVEFYQRVGPVRRRIIQMILNRADELVVLSPVWRERLTRITAKRPISVIGNPVDLANVASNQKSDPHTVLFVGKICRDKGVFDLVEALPLVRAAVSSVRLIVAGTGASAELMECAGRVACSDLIELVGWVTGEAKSKLFGRCAVYVLPSYIECMPVGLLEAMACGCAVVATPIGGIPDVVEDGTNGLLVTPGDRQALADALVRLLNDSELRRCLGAEARRTVYERYTLETILPKLEAIYERLGVQPIP